MTEADRQRQTYLAATMVNHACNAILSVEQKVSKLCLVYVSYSLYIKEDTVICVYYKLVNTGYVTIYM